MKRGLIFWVIFLVLLSSFASAGFFSDIFNKVTGRVSYVLKCDDSDGGDNVFQRGKAVGGRGGEGIDYCDNGQIKEYYCDMAAFEVKWNVQNCPEGYTCKNGACVEKEERLKTSELEGEDSVVLVVGEEQNFGFDSLELTELSLGEADITYTMKIRAKDGDMYVFGGNKFEVNVNGEDVELVNKGKLKETVEVEVEKIVEVEKEVEVKKVGFWSRLFGSF